MKKKNQKKNSYEFLIFINSLIRDVYINIIIIWILKSLEDNRFIT